MPDADGHLFLMHAEELITVAKDAGLEVEKLILFTNPLTAGHIKLEALLRVLPRRAVFAFEACTEASPQFLARRISTQLAARLRVP